MTNLKFLLIAIWLMLSCLVLAAIQKLGEWSTLSKFALYITAGTSLVMLFAGIFMRDKTKGDN